MKISSSAFMLGFGLLSRSVAVENASGSMDITQQEVLLGSEIPRTAADIWTSLTTNKSCLGCQGILSILQTLASLGDDAFVRVLQQVCGVASAEDEDVCDGAVALEGPILAASLRDLALGSKTSQTLCATLLGICEFPGVEPYTVPVPPQSSQPSTAKTTAGNAASRAPLKIAHFSDIHIDPLYVTGAYANCTKPMCCRPYTPADFPGNNDAPAGPFGDHNCGAPLSLEQSMYAAIQSLSPDFALFTGDIVDHAVWNTTVDQNSAEISMAYQHMAESGMQLVYGTVGNHEMSPANAIPPTHLGTSAQWLFNVVSEAWERWIGSPAEVKTFGAYSVKLPQGNLRIISVSTNMWYTLNFWLYQQVRKDPSDHLQWLVGQLDAAEKAGERVYLVGHMPMGSPDAFHDASNYFDQVVNRYKSSIAGMFFGHTHLDHFQISYSDYKNRSASNAIAMSYIAPSMTPLSGMPAFRIYTVDPETFGILDIDTYIADMTNPDFQNGPKWTKYYSAKETFGPLVIPPISVDAELTPAFWHNVTLALEADPTTFQTYWTRRTRGWRVQQCDETCRRSEICQLRAARSQDNCFVPTPGASFGIRAEEAAKPAKCDRSVARETVGSLAVRKGLIELLERLTREESRG